MSQSFSLASLLVEGMSLLLGARTLKTKWRFTRWYLVVKGGEKG